MTYLDIQFRVIGIEPISFIPKTNALPLCYTLFLELIIKYKFKLFFWWGVPELNQLFRDYEPLQLP